jgi:hypothetical protein
VGGRRRRAGTRADSIGSLTRGGSRRPGGHIVSRRPATTRAGQLEPARPRPRRCGTARSSVRGGPRPCLALSTVALWPRCVEPRGPGRKQSRPDLPPLSHTSAAASPLLPPVRATDRPPVRPPGQVSTMSLGRPTDVSTRARTHRTGRPADAGAHASPTPTAASASRGRGSPREGRRTLLVRAMR